MAETSQSRSTEKIQIPSVQLDKHVDQHQIQLVVPVTFIATVVGQITKSVLVTQGYIPIQCPKWHVSMHVGQSIDIIL